MLLIYLEYRVQAARLIRPRNGLNYVSKKQIVVLRNPSLFLPESGVASPDYFAAWLFSISDLALIC